MRALESSRLLSLGVVLLASALLVREAKEWRGAGKAASPVASFEPRWREALAAATVRTNPDAPVTLVEFVDFECPACRRMHPIVDSLRSQFGSRLSVALVHFPLKNHTFARRAARSFECGREDSTLLRAARVFAMTSRQIGSTSDSIASVLGVRNVNAFSRCMRDSVIADEPVRRGRAVGDSLGVTATPTLLLNGWRFQGIVARSHMQVAVGDLLAGRTMRFAGRSP